MYSKIKCANPIVLQEMCDRLNEMRIQYLMEIRVLELCIKSDPDIVCRIIEENKFEAQLLINA